ncbi:DUF4424 family protein [Methylocystis heyeri]|nr:DUF4424 family protein [Methylocystis heyeri]
MIRSRRMCNALVAVLALLTAPEASYAQESLTELLQRGPSFANSSSEGALVIDSQDVSVDPHSIRLKYRISNSSAEALTTVLTMPLPDLDFNDPDASLAIPGTDPTNFMEIKASADQKPLNFVFTQSAFANDKDVSPQLRANHLPLVPVDGFQNQLSALGRGAREKLADQGLLARSGTNQAGETLYFPTWIVKTTGRANLSIAAGQSLSIELRYRTSLGVSKDSVWREPLRSQRGLAAEIERRRVEYCPDHAVYAGVDKLVSTYIEQTKNLEAGKESAKSVAKPDPVPSFFPFSLFQQSDSPPPPAAETAKPAAPPPVANVANLREWRIALDLATGSPPMPVKEFRLLVDKAKKDRVVSFCMNNLKRVSSTAFEMRATDFTPLQPLKIILVGPE